MKTFDRGIKINYSDLSIDIKINCRTFINAIPKRYKLCKNQNYYTNTIDLYSQPMYLQDCYVNEKESIREAKWKY